MAFEWRTARAIVSGGASGLGQAVVESVIAAGGQVSIVDTHISAGERLALKLGPRAHFVAADVCAAEALMQAIQMIAERFGGVDLAVCCAGSASQARLLGREGPHDPQLFSRVLDINLSGTFHMVRAAAEVMARNVADTDDQARGVIVMTSSIAAFEGQVGQVAYAASKGGVASMTVPLAREMSRFGVRIMTIAPGLFDTPMSRSFPCELRQRLVEQIPFPKRPGDPQEYARLVRAIYENPFLNGEIIRLDGALRMA